MKRIVVLSTNENPDYFFYLPIAEWAWNKLGWEVAVFVTKKCHTLTRSNKSTEFYEIPDIEGVRTGTLAQTVRHFASNVLPKDAYIQVNDIDLIPFKEWNPDPTKKTIYGWELTGNSFIPVHYTGMMGHDWYDVMGCTGDLKADMEREMKANGRAYKEKWEEYWDTDWDILTQKVLARKNEFTFIERGMVQLGKYKTAKGRVDRCSIVVEPDGKYSFDYTLNQSDLIDLHGENDNPSAPEKWASVRPILERCLGPLPEWMDSYVSDHFKKYGR